MAVDKLVWAEPEPRPEPQRGNQQDADSEDFVDLEGPRTIPSTYTRQKVPAADDSE